MSQVTRHVNGKARDLTQLSQNEQLSCFNTVFGTPEDLLDLSARTFNLVLALQDLRRFETADYNVWYFSQISDEAGQEYDPIFTDIAAQVLAAPPGIAQVASLAHAWQFVPYWRVLESSGPWSEDALADFAASFLQRLDRMPLSLSVESVLSAENEFCKLLHGARARLPVSFQPSLLVLVEGTTETVLLPRFLSLMSAGKKGQEISGSADQAAMFISCGGANQLLRKYLHLQDITRLPILCVIDHDATEQIKTIREMQRDIDYLHVWSVGEIEDTFDRNALLGGLNAYLTALGASDLLLPEDLCLGARRV